MKRKKTFHEIINWGNENGDSKVIFLILYVPMFLFTLIALLPTCSDDEDFLKPQPYETHYGVEGFTRSHSENESNVYHIKINSKSDCNDNWIDDLDGADRSSSVFEEYMEELDSKGIEPGTPEAADVWENNYK